MVILKYKSHFEALEAKEEPFQIFRHGTDEFNT